MRDESLEKLPPLTSALRLTRPAYDSFTRRTNFIISRCSDIIIQTTHANF